MIYQSTRNSSYKVGFKEAVMSSLATDGGLYVPEIIPQASPVLLECTKSTPIRKLAFEIAKLYIAESEIPRDNLEAMIDRAIDFESPVIHLEDNINTLELWHGPSLAFKDFGARFMAEVMSYFADKERLTVLVATSGDTGGAVAYGFLGKPNIDVIILYPKSKVSKWQERQLTTLGNNITALEIEGSFDNCQSIVKQSFVDKEINNLYKLTSANSINIARLIPQIFYYFEAYKQIAEKGEEIVFSVPSGNFGNLTAGLMAKMMGLPIKQMIASTNLNNVVPKYLESGIYHPMSSKPTISNAMDVGNPSNFERMRFLLGDQLKNFRKNIAGYWYSDEESLEAIYQLFNRYGYISEPHGAIGYLGLKKYLEETKFEGKAIFLGTAHPSKFIDSVKDITGEFEIPARLKSLEDKEKRTVEIGKDFGDFKEWMLRRR